MTRFFRRSGVKAICTVLCVLCLTLSLLSGAAVLTLLAHDGYRDPSKLYASMIQSRIQDDANQIMYGYFDPADPTHPWVSYYGGGIYSGESSNFIFRIVDDDTGKCVLSSYDGTPFIMLQREIGYSFEDTVEVEDSPAKSPVTALDKPFFRCAGVLYAYMRDMDAFAPVEEAYAEYMTELPELPVDILYTGLAYGGMVYAFDGDAFYPSYSLEATRYESVSHGYTITCYLLSGLPHRDFYRETYDLSQWMLRHSYDLIVVLAVSPILGLLLLGILCRTVCRRNSCEELILSPIFRVPTDLGLVLAVPLFLVAAGVCLDGVYPVRNALALMLLVQGCCCAVLSLSGVYVIVLIAARAKTGKLLRGTLLFWLWENGGRGLRALGRFLLRMLSYLPLVWKVLACYGLFLVLEAMVMAICDVPGSLLLFWLPGRILAGAAILYVTLSFRRLKTGAEAIAAGDYSATVSEKHLILDFKDTAETLNHIQDGMNEAVARQTRSERMKTELITNVSHDLKTPLTSIVSYVDLLRQELDRSQAVTNEARNYLEVLDRQSARLKKLIEDLVEASKASTGNLNLHMEPLDLAVVLDQAIGEYAQRIHTAGLTLMTKLLPQASVPVLADGRGLWRVFDNLLGNAVKYAMPGTRLYLTVDVKEDHASVAFRNISREPLGMGAEELMERFVRGDESRHTEGSGLGLSIARSLTEAMGGSFALDLDGDLFKVTVSLPLLPESLPEAQNDSL